MWSKNYLSEKVYIGKYSHEEDLLGGLNSFCFENNITIGWVNIIGAVKKAKIGYYIQESKKYVDIEESSFNKPFEIAGCMGNISIKEGKPFAHLHIILTDEQGRAFGGHVMPGTVIFAGEFIIQKFKGEELKREYDNQTGQKKN